MAQRRVNTDGAAVKILILGCGSIGTRRAKILASKGHEIRTLDTDIERARSLAKAMPAGLGVYIEGAGFAPDTALICTPPDSGRPEQIQRCLEMGVKGLFVEKPLALDASDVDEIARMFGERVVPGSLPYAMAIDNPNVNVVTMGACNLRFVGGISGLRKIPKPWRLARFRMGQAAKFWSPTHRPISLILDSIHELDLAVYLQGPIETIRGYSETNAAEVSVHHAGGGLSHIFLDRKADPPMRDVHITRGGDVDFLMLRTNDGMYEREMEHFIGCVEAGMQTCNPLRAAAEVCSRALEVVA